MKLNWSFLGEGGGGEGGAEKKNYLGGSMDIFWNCTMLGLFRAKIITWHFASEKIMPSKRCNIPSNFCTF